MFETRQLRNAISNISAAVRRGLRIIEAHYTTDKQRISNGQGQRQRMNKSGVDVEGLQDGRGDAGDGLYIVKVIDGRADNE